ncbi:MAG: LysR family transcriptional regulator [Polyangiales bacterium]
MHFCMRYPGWVMDDVSWDLLRSFLSVLREGSLGKAAVALGTSQSSLTRHVQQLEARLGAELFERHARRMVPTPLARDLGEAASAMHEGAAQVEALRARHARAEARSVRISASRMVATHLLPPLLAPLLAPPGAPNIELLSDDALSNLSERTADLAVRLVKPAQASLVARRVGSIHLGFYAARTYLATRPAPTTLAALLGHVVVGFDRSALMVRRARAMGAPSERAHYRFRSDDRVVHWAAVRAGVGIGVLPTYLAAREPGLTRLLPGERLAPTGVWLVAQREVLARAEVRATFEALRASMHAVLAAAAP